MNIAALITIAQRDFLKDTVATNQFSDAFYLSAFSEAQRKACGGSDFIYDDTLTVTFIDGQAGYTLPARLTRLCHVVYDNVEIRKVHQDQLPNGWRTDTGFTESSVQSYYIKGNKIYFYPTPDAADATLTAYLQGYVLPADFTATSDTPYIPVEFHYDLIYWVAHKAFAADVMLENDLDGKYRERSERYLALFNQKFSVVAAHVRQHILEN